MPDGASAVDSMGRTSRCQFGGKHPSAKPWKGQRPGVFEIVEDFDGDTYRAVYTVKFKEAVHVRHAFQKKSPKGIRTARGNIAFIEQRLKAAPKDYEEYCDKTK